MRKEVKIKIIRDDGKEFIIDHSVWGIPSDGLIGFDSVENDIFTNALATGDGSNYVSSRVPEKDRTIKARLLDSSLNESQRYLVIAFFNIKHQYDVYVTYQGRTRWCTGRQFKFECPTFNVYKPLEFTWTLLCTMPYMKSVENFGKNIGEILPMYNFPYKSIVGYGFSVGVLQFSSNVLLKNNGDVETYFKCIIQSNGEVVNPKIIKDKKYVRIKDTLQKGDVYVIDFEVTPPTVKKNGQNAIGKIDRTSSLSEMTVEVGDNRYSFEADSGSVNMSVEIYRYERYTGI